MKMKMINKKLLLLGVMMSATILATQVVSAGGGDQTTIDQNQNTETVEPSVPPAPDPWPRDPWCRYLVSLHDQEPTRSVIEDQPVITTPQIISEKKTTSSKFIENLIKALKNFANDVTSLHKNLNSAAVDNHLRQEVKQFIKEKGLRVKEEFKEVSIGEEFKEVLEEQFKELLEKDHKAVFPKEIFDVTFLAEVTGFRDLFTTDNLHREENQTKYPIAYSLVIISSKINQDLEEINHLIPPDQESKTLFKIIKRMMFFEYYFIRHNVMSILDGTEKMVDSKLVPAYFDCFFSAPEVWIEKHNLVYLEHNQLMQDFINNFDTALQGGDLKLAQATALTFEQKLLDDNAKFENENKCQEFDEKQVLGFVAQNCDFNFKFTKEALARADFSDKISQIFGLVNADKPALQTRAEFERIKALKINKILVELGSEPTFRTSGFVVSEFSYQRLGITEEIMKRADFVEKMCRIIDLIYSKKPVFQNTEKFENDKKVAINDLLSELGSEVIL